MDKPRWKLPCPALSAKACREIARSLRGENVDAIGLRVRRNKRTKRPVLYIWQAFTAVRLDHRQCAALAADLLAMLAETRAPVPRRVKREVRRSARRLRCRRP